MLPINSNFITDLASSTIALRDTRRFIPEIGLSLSNFGAIASLLILKPTCKILATNPKMASGKKNGIRIANNLVITSKEKTLASSILLNCKVPIF